MLFTPDGRLITGDIDGKLMFWTGEGKLIRTVVAHEYPVQALAISSDGKTLATAGLPFFYLEQGGTVAFSKSGRWLASNANSTVVLWDWASRKVVRVFKRHADNVEALTFTPDEQHLITVGHDGTTRVWDVDDGYSMAMLARGADWIVYTPDGYFDSSHYGGELVAITDFPCCTSSPLMLSAESSFLRVRRDFDADVLFAYNSWNWNAATTTLHRHDNNLQVSPGWRDPSMGAGSVLTRAVCVLLTRLTVFFVDVRVICRSGCC